VRTTRQFRVFLVLTAALTLGFLGWAWIGWRGEAPERAAWASVERDLEAQSARIDSLKRALAVMDEQVAGSKREVASAGERLGHWGRQAVDGKLLSAEHREYLREIDGHNEAVATHNAELAEMQRVHAEYSALVDTHNALVDSANVLQRRAVQEGIQLADPQ
jgi:predicted  nucleic acid-binding Zn-ribbon protein